MKNNQILESLISKIASIIDEADKELKKENQIAKTQ